MYIYTYMCVYIYVCICLDSARQSHVGLFHARLKKNKRGVRTVTEIIYTYIYIYVYIYT